MGANTGIISGTTTTAGTYNVTATVDDGNGNSDSANFVWTVNPQGGGNCGGLIQEAESGTLFGNFVIGSDPTASAGQYVHVPDGAGDFWGGVSGDKVEYCVNITTAGDYAIKTLVSSPDYAANSFFVQVDGLPVDTYLWDSDPVASGFVVDYVVDRNGPDPLVLSLGVGEHTITFYVREDGTQLDQIELEFIPPTGAPTITNPGNQSNVEGDSVNLPINATDPNGDPLTYSASGLPPGLSINSTTGVISGTTTTAGVYNATVTVDDGNGGTDSASFVWVVNSPGSGNCGGLIQEAEDGTLFGNFTLGNDALASGGQYVHVPDGAGDSYSGVSAHKVEYCVSIPTAGDYLIKAQISSPDYAANSFYVQVDGLSRSKFQVLRENSG
ncbi:putative Ig domain-containing protein [Chloroflexi bacterium TSY]|nr:putative Ig domain-containing protein [Chloroflexi bacterium TSY]